MYEVEQCVYIIYVFYMLSVIKAIHVVVLIQKESSLWEVMTLGLSYKLLEVV